MRERSSHCRDRCKARRPELPTRATGENEIARIFRNTGEKFQPRLPAVFLAFAAELLELGEHGADVEFSRFLLRLRGGGDFGFLARRRFGGRKECCASINR